MFLSMITRLRLATNHCYLCLQPSGHPVCCACLQEVASFETHGENVDFISNQHTFARHLPKLRAFDTLCIGPHTGVLQRLISLLKYSYKMELSETLGKLLLLRIYACYDSSPLPQALIPVPIHPLKRLQRGFNQTELIANVLADKLQMPVLTLLFKKIKSGKAQAGLSGKQRRQLASSVFRIAQIEKIKALQHIAIIDDVITTGTTMSRLCNLLREVNPEIQIDLWSLSVSLPHR